MDKMDILVSIHCLAYNHEPYIRKCLDGFIMQKTNFKFEVLIHDDASTDNTAQIIKEYEKKYPDIIKPIYQTENQYSKGISISLKYQYPRVRGKYIAICEGDDFWTDDMKLQTQVDFLESNTEYVLCGHSAYLSDGNDVLSKNNFFSYGKGNRVITTEEIISGWAMATNTMVFRKSARGEDPIPYKGNAFNGDYALMTYLSLQGKVFFIDKLMSAYRVESRGSLLDVWRRDWKKRLEADERLIALLDRLNSYTNYQYADSVNIKQSYILYHLLEDSNDSKEFKKCKSKYKGIYSKFLFKQRIQLVLCIYFPDIYRLLKRAKKIIKQFLKI